MSPTDTPRTMSPEEEIAFMESMVDFTGGMPPTPDEIFDADTLLDLFTVQMILGRLDILRNLGGQRSTPLLEVLRDNAKRDTEPNSSRAPQSGLVAQLLSLTPAQAEPAALIRAATADLTRRATPTVLPAFSNPPPEPTTPPMPRVRRKLNTSAAYTSGERTIYPTTLDPTVPEPNLKALVWVSCFTDIPSTPPPSNPAPSSPQSPYTPGSTSSLSSFSSPLSALSSSPSPDVVLGGEELLKRSCEK
ncbi:hypothetical protein DFH07DRAFT_1066077 [Mycena maculata]|uniref:Uncharacterized protein n=1 Tax=Mycena maculata TaxID=230809 RepID=A0AAD7HWY6_9AGAR|nr:hypothetical protein DFH07DRAFT_1066077 [Mycena maculata]